MPEMNEQVMSDCLHLCVVSWQSTVDVHLHFLLGKPSERGRANLSCPFDRAELKMTNRTLRYDFVSFHECLRVLKGRRLKWLFKEKKNNSTLSILLFPHSPPLLPGVSHMFNNCPTTALRNILIYISFIPSKANLLYSILQYPHLLNTDHYK